MTEHQVAPIYLADMRAMLAAMRRYLDQLGAGPPQPLLTRTAGDLRHTAATLAELSGAFHVPDCAAVCEGLTQAFAPIASGGALPATLLAPAGDALAYLGERAARMTAVGLLVAPSVEERAAASRLVALVVTAGDPAVAWKTLGGVANPAPLVGDEPATLASVLTPEELALIQAFRDTPLAPRRPHGSGEWPTGQSPEDSPYTAPLDPASALPAEILALPAHLLQVFISDLEQNLQELRLALEQLPDDRARLPHMALVAHRIKGDAGTFEFALLAELAHTFEEQLRALQSRQVATDARSLELLARSLSELDHACAAIVAGAQPETDALARMRATTAALLGDAPAGAGRPPADAPTQPALPLMAPPAELVGAAESEPGSSVAHMAGGESLLRVDARRMDDLLRRTSALAVNRAGVERVRTAAAESRDDLDRAVSRLETLSARLHALPSSEPPTPAPAFPGGPAPAPDSERDTDYDQLTRALTETVADVASCGMTLRAVLQRLRQLTEEQEVLAHDIQQAVMGMRLVPLRDQVVLLQQAIRVLAPQQGKAVAFVTHGELGEIDREVSEELSEVLLHLVRNAVTHGIERPEERFAAGKPPEGQITLSTHYSGNEVAIEVRDDGRGINPERVRASARAANTLDATAAHALSAGDALDLIFAAGVSTASRATLDAGHGMGLADVATMLNRLHGSIQVRSRLGEGTSFTVRVPISLSNIRALRVRVAGHDYLVPRTAIRQTLPLPAQPEPGESAADVGAAGADGASAREDLPWRLALMVEGRPEETPLFALAHALGRPYQAAPEASALVVEAERRRVAFVVDESAGDMDVVVRALPAHLRRAGVRGTTITPGGELLLVLDLPALATRALARAPLGQPAPRPPEPTPPRAASGRPRVLLADDSVSMRHAIAPMLARAGFAVATARDGVEALEAVLADPPDLLILDIEMPQLDGFELLGVLRAQPRLAAIPVAMLTSRGAQHHRQHAAALGANAYLIKPVAEEELLATVARLLAAAATHAPNGGAER